MKYGVLYLVIALAFISCRPQYQAEDLKAGEWKYVGALSNRVGFKDLLLKQDSLEVSFRVEFTRYDMECFLEKVNCKRADDSDIFCNQRWILDQRLIKKEPLINVNDSGFKIESRQFYYFDKLRCK